MSGVTKRKAAMSNEDATERLVTARIQENLALSQALLADKKLLGTVAEVGKRMARALAARQRVFFFGNGGSAADAQHLAAELVGRFGRERRALPAIALTTDTSAITAVANDSSFERIFARQIEALAEPGDVAVGISTSGKSPNVIAAISGAKERGLVTVGMTGGSGRELAAAADYCIRIPSDNTARVQEKHILIGHILCEIVETELFPGSEK
jgi:D-sedoheptulose 7-phosphate isomerase